MCVCVKGPVFEYSNLGKKAEIKKQWEDWNR